MPTDRQTTTDTGAPLYLYDVFLSHHSSDKPLVEMIAARLEDEAGLKPFLDKWHLVPGEPWVEELEAALDKSATCAVFLGSSGLGAWHNEEMRAALDERVRNKSFRVVPVLLPGAEPKDKDSLPRFLRRLTWVDFRAGLDDREAFNRLVAGIKGVPPGRSLLTPSRQLDKSTSMRRIDAAVPSTAEIGQRIDLLVQVRLPNSPTLGIEDWPLKQKPKSVEQGQEFAELVFPVNSKTGEIAASRLRIRIVAPDFDIEGAAEKILTVPPNKLSKLLTFLLSAKKEGNCRINVEVYDITFDCLGTVPIETTVGRGQNAQIVSIANFFFVVTTRPFSMHATNDNSSQSAQSETSVQSGTKVRLNSAGKEERSEFSMAIWKVVLVTMFALLFISAAIPRYKLLIEFSAFQKYGIYEAPAGTVTIKWTLSKEQWFRKVQVSDVKANVTIKEFGDEKEKRFPDSPGQVTTSLRPGRYEVRIDAVEHVRPETIVLEISASETAELTGTVVDQNESPIQGVRITIDEVPGMKPVETSSDGVFIIKDVPRKYSDMVRIRIVKEGYQPNPYTDDVVIGASPPRIKLRRER